MNYTFDDTKLIIMWAEKPWTKYWVTLPIGAHIKGGGRKLFKAEKGGGG